ncbi:MAG: hypothetical protein FD180_4751 [Planctomycetota bacterium]|nr:MAG: hypothetical protein FD180_4751 [Planctomycetota bacterium]
MNAFTVTPGLLEPAIALEAQVSRTNLSEVWKGTRRGGVAAVAVKFAISSAAAASLEPQADTVSELRASGVRGIVPTFFSSAPVPHLVMPWIPGGTFREILQSIRSGDDRARAMRMLFRVIATVARVHAEGFIHGDLKPENILVEGDLTPLLTDFGMARAVQRARLDSEVSRSMDESAGGWGGTLHYMPPEGLHGEPPAPSWDVYAIGVMLHEVLLGARPDRAATPESLRAVLPGAVVDLLLAALAYSPADRIPTVPRLLALLKPIQDELTLTGPARLARRAGRLALAGLAAFFVALRYASVLVLLSGYAALLIAAIFMPPFLLGLLPFVILHMVVRWEGPESEEEARIRKQGGVV